MEVVEVNASFIPLTQDKVAVVDTEDYNKLNQLKWYAMKKPHTHYAVRLEHLGFVNGKRKQLRVNMHRLIVNPPKNKFVDHIDGDGLNNRKSNLRICSTRQNQQNQKNRKHQKTSKYPGVYWDKESDKWKAQILLNNKKKNLGRFLNENDAAKAYEKALREKVGEELICKMEGK